MGWGSGRQPSFVREALLALLVLAVIFLNFNTASIAVATDTQVTAPAITSFCGDHPPGDCSQIVCHACRPNIADLPPPPSAVVPVVFVAARVVYVVDILDIDFLPPQIAPPTRAPPALI